MTMTHAERDAGESVCGTGMYLTVDAHLKRKECRFSFPMDYCLIYCLRLYVNELSMWSFFFRVSKYDHAT